MVRSSQLLIIGIALMLLSACSGATKPTLAPTNLPPAGPTVPFSNLPAGTPSDPQRTPAPSSGPTLAANPAVAFKFARAVPDKIGRFTLDKDRSYVDPGGHGAVLFYVLPNVGDLQVSLWLMKNAVIPDWNVNDAIDRFDLETSRVPMENRIPVSIGERAIVSPQNKVPETEPGKNLTAWGEMQFRNTVIILYPSKELVAKVTDFSNAEATEFLQKMFDAIPKS